MNISNNTIVTNLDTAKAAPSTTISLGGFADGDMITKPKQGKCLNCSDRALQRMVERFEIPPPTTLGGRKVWIVGKIRAWFTDAAERREAETLKETRRLRILDT